MTSVELKEYIYNNQKIEYLLNELGCHKIKYNESKEYWSGARPDGDNLGGVIIRNNTYLNYYSYSHNVDVSEHKDIFDFIQDIKNISFGEAIKYVHNLFGLSLSYKKKEETDDKPKVDPLAIFKKAACKKKYCNVLEFNILDEDVLNDFVPMIHIDIFREGIVKKTIEKFGLMYSYSMRRTIYPHRLWMDGSLLGYNARTSVENYEEFGIRKYYLTKDMNKSNNVYGFWENRKDIEKAGYCVLGESEKACCLRDSRNDPTWLALSGHSISSEQVRIILSLNVREIIIAVDKDVPEVEVWDLCEKFFRIRKVSYIKDNWNLLKGGKDSPADASNKIYKFLFDHRITYGENEHKKYLESLEVKHG